MCADWCSFLFIRSFVCLFVRSSIDPFIHPFIHSCMLSFVRSFVRSFISFTYFVDHLLIYLFTPLLIHPQHTHTQTHIQMYMFRIILHIIRKFFSFHIIIMNMYIYVYLYVFNSFYIPQLPVPRFTGTWFVWFGGLKGDLVPRSRCADVLQHAGIRTDQASWASQIPTVPFWW